MSARHSLDLVPFVSQLWLAFYQQAVHCPVLKEDTVYDVLSYCFSLPASNTGTLRALLQTFVTSRLLVLQDGTFYLSRTPHVQGFLTYLAPCYAPGCHPSLPPCYSSTCPNRFNTQWLQLHSLLEKKSSWHDHAPAYILNHYPSSEIKRQCVLAELLQSELDYCNDLAILDQVYGQPLLAQPDARLRAFYDMLIAPPLDLKQYHHDLCHWLVRHRQDPLLLFNDVIGPTLLDHVNALFDPYVRAAALSTKGHYLLKVEMHKNPVLRALIHQQNTHQLTRKLDLDHFLKRPTLRLTKFKIQLEAIHKHSDHVHDDQVHLLTAIDLLHQLLDEVNDAVRKAEAHVHLHRISTSLVPPNNNNHHHHHALLTRPPPHLKKHHPHHPHSMNQNEPLNHEKASLPLPQQEKQQQQQQMQLQGPKFQVPPRQVAQLPPSPPLQLPNVASPANSLFSSSLDVASLLKDASLLHEGQFRLARSSSHSLRAQPCHVFLFAHALLLTKPKVTGVGAASSLLNGASGAGNTDAVSGAVDSLSSLSSSPPSSPLDTPMLEVIRRPIPLPMLCVSIHRAPLINRLSRRLSKQQQFAAATVSPSPSTASTSVSSPLSPTTSATWMQSPPIRSNITRAASPAPQMQQNAVDLRHRFSITSTTSSWSSSSSSSAGSSSLSSSSASTSAESAAVEPPAPPSLPLPLPLPRAMASSSPLKRSMSPSAPNWVQQQPTVTGLHIRAHLRKQMHQLKRLRPPTPLSRTTSSASFSTARQSLHQNHQNEHVLHGAVPLSAVQPPPLTESPRPMSPVSASARVAPRVQSPRAFRSVSIRRLHGAPCTLVIRHLADPDFLLEIKARSTRQRDQWYEWISAALEQSAQHGYDAHRHLRRFPHPHQRPRGHPPAPFHLDILCEILVATKQTIQMDGDVKLSGGCGRIFCTLPFVTSDGTSVMALGTQHGLWMAPSTSNRGQGFRLIEMMECQQLALIHESFLIARSGGTVKLYAACDLLDRMAGANADTVSLHQATSTTSHTIKSSGVIDVVVGKLFDHPVVCYLSKCSLRKRQRYRPATRLLVIGTVRESSGHIYFKKEKTIPLLMKNAASIAIMDNVVFVCSPDQGMERVDPWTGISHLQQSLPAAGANAMAANKWIGCVRVPSPAKNDHTRRYRHATQEDDGNDDDNDDENAHFLLSCTDTAAWLLNKYTMATHDAPCIRFEANARFVAVVDAFLVLFAKFIIEIRHIQTGEIVQVIPGHDIRCVHVQESTIIFTMMKTPHDRISTIYRLVL